MDSPLVQVGKPITILKLPLPKPVDPATVLGKAGVVTRFTPPTKRLVVVLKSKHYKVDALIGPTTGVHHSTPVVLDTGAGPNIITEERLPADWRTYSIPLDNPVPLQ